MPTIVNSDDEVSDSAHDHKPAQKKSNRKGVTESTREDPERSAGRKQCLFIAKYIPCGLDAFCNLDDIIQVGCLIQRYPYEDERPDAVRTLIDEIDNRTGERYQRIYDYLITHAPYLIGLVGNRTKGIEVNKLVKEMQASVMHIRAEDGCRLRKMVGQYAAPDPSKQVVHPPVSPETKGGHACMGFNHSQLGRMLCPVKYLKDYTHDENGTRKRFDDPSDPLKVTSNVWPAFVYPGNVPGSEYNPRAISEGLFRGYFVERTLKHIFTSPSSALQERAKGAKSGNAKLHGMKVVEPEHIAYAVMQARFVLSSAEKWSEQDGLFNYQEFYYRITQLIRETRDRAWAEGLLRYYNEKLFGNPNGLMTTDSATAANGDDDLLEMEMQFEARENELLADVTARVNPDEEDFRQLNDDTMGTTGADDDALSGLRTSHGPPSAVDDSAGLTSNSHSSTMTKNASPGPGPSAMKRKQADTLNFFDDDGPLTEDEEGTNEPKPARVQKKRGRVANEKAPAKARSSRTQRKK